VRQRMRDVEETIPFADKIQKLIWRGAVTPSVAPTLRQHLLDQTVNQTWADVQVLDWSAKDDSKRNRINIEDHCKYQFIQHTAGSSLCHPLPIFTLKLPMLKNTPQAEPGLVG
jgi:hypothetical protein